MKQFSTIYFQTLLEARSTNDQTTVATAPAKTITNAAAGVLDSLSKQNTNAQSASASSPSKTSTTATTPAPGKIISDISGSFYGEKLYWSAENKELYFEGKTVIDFGENYNIVNGRSSFLGQVNHFVFEGRAVKPGDILKWNSRKYKLVQLSTKSAIEKFGDAGKNGTVEISTGE